ncbi:MAG TPA: hypothetical protein VLV83_21430, partial [Acidobacteriota bacterium]|nr:hypothetical protein [Acidobacteriota bacterium]
EAEEALRSRLMAARRFLQEHAQYGLPELEPVSRHFQKKGCSVLQFPNGYLPHWLEGQALSQHYFALDDYGCNTLFNRLLNRLRYRFDLRDPAYRRLLLISKEPWPEAQQRRLEDALRGEAQSAPAPVLSQDPGFLNLQEQVVSLLEKRRGPLGDAFFLLNEREKHIGLLLDSVRELERLNAQPLHKIALRRLKEKR